MARKRSTRRRTTRRRTTKRRAFTRGGSNFLPAGAIPTALATAGGFFGVPMATGMIPVAALQTGWGGVAAKVGVSALAWMLGRRVLGTKHATALAIGGLTSAAVDAMGRVMSGGGGGVNGLGADGRYYVGGGGAPYSFSPYASSGHAYSALPSMRRA